jgi:uncharacterized protein YbaA (DUF1428 family)
MTYVEGFVTPVPTSNRDAYAEHAAQAAELFKEFGATRVVEAWGDDVPDGEVTDFKRAVKAKNDETVAFGWLEFPTKEARDAFTEKMQSDERTKDMGDSMPFDGQRMIFGGFAPIVEEGNGERGGYVDGYVVPVPSGKKQAYRDVARKAAEVFKEHGAIRMVEGWGDDVPEGEVTDFRRAVKAKDDETVVYSFIEWPTREARDKGMKEAMEDPRMQLDRSSMPFDGQRMIYGGFASLLDE